ncbi:MAG: fibronectin/fibrinogen-binding protein [Clostridiales bacterium]|nr:fibronectin/fibrinogen-binding protein [Clostridiales bacterium]
MPMDGLTLGFIARELQETLQEGRIEKVTQPEKDMLVLLIRSQGKNHKLLLSAAPSFARAHLTGASYQNPQDAPMFCMLMRKHLQGGRLTRIEQLGGDRVLRLVIENKDELGDTAPRELYLELMGRHSNLTLVMNGRIVDAIRHVSGDMSRVRQALPGLPFVLPPEQDKLDPARMEEEQLFSRLSVLSGPLDKALGASIRGLSPVAAREVAFRATGMSRTDMEGLKLDELAKVIVSFFQRLPSMGPPTAQLCEDQLITDVLPFPYFSLNTQLQKPFSSLSTALDAFYFGRDRRDRMAQKSASLKRLIKTHMERDEKKLALQEEELTASAKMEEYRIAGELLTAQSYLVPRGAEKVQLPNFYDEKGGMMEIELDVALTPAQNAQKYFKRYRKARSAQELAKGQKEKTLKELEILEQALFDLEECETEQDLSDVRKALEDAGLVRAPAGKKKPRQQESVPLRFLSPDGTEIIVGKNSAQNDRLTGSARGNETWLHAKDMPGSHVIIRSENVAPETLMMALKLAAWYSKGKGVSVPVDYTLRKHVKKPGGAPAGFVIYTHQKTVIISATEGEIAAMKRG